MKIPAFHSPSLRIHPGELGDVGDCGRLRGMEGKHHFFICVYMCSCLHLVFWVRSLWP